jgi:hypothetical protein
MQSVIDEPLHRRKEILQSLIIPCPPEGLKVGRGAARGCVIPLLADQPHFAGDAFSRMGASEDDIKRMFEFAIRKGVCPYSAFEIFFWSGFG